MEISLYVCDHLKKYPENFAFLILWILELFTRGVCKFLKEQANFQHILLFLNVCKETFHISHMCTSLKVKGVLMWDLQYTIFIWRRGYCQIFKSALVYLQIHIISGIVKKWYGRECYQMEIPVSDKTKYFSLKTKKKCETC